MVSRWWGASARQGERIGAGVRGWGQVELRRMGRIASESYGCDDGAMRMREGSICGRGAGCASARETAFRRNPILADVRAPARPLIYRLEHSYHMESFLCSCVVDGLNHAEQENMKKQEGQMHGG